MKVIVISETFNMVKINQLSQKNRDILLKFKGFIDLYRLSDNQRIKEDIRSMLQGMRVLAQVLIPDVISTFNVEEDRYTFIFEEKE